MFDDFRLDVGRRMLYRGNVEVLLPPKAIETLSVLASNRGEIISKEDLIAAVWKDTFVEDSNLFHYIHILRKALGSRPDGSPYIETLRRRGYRLSCEVWIVASSSAPDRLHGNESQSREDAPSIVPIREPETMSGKIRNATDAGGWVRADRADSELAAQVSAVRKTSLRRVVKPWLMTAALLAVSVVFGVGYSFYNQSGLMADIGEPETIVERLTNGIDPRSATISPDGKYFVYLESGALHRMWLQQTGYSGRVEIITPSKNPICCTTISPDSAFVFYLASDPTDDSRSLYRVPTLGGQSTKVVTNVASAVSFSANGNEMAYARYDKQKNETQYIIGSSDGSGRERVAYSFPGQYATGPAWSPDGNTIVFARSSSDGESDFALTVVDLRDGSAKPVSHEWWDICHRIMWRADGSGFYFVGTKKGDHLTPRRDQLYFVSYPDGRSTRITNDPANRQQADSIGVTQDGVVLTVPYNRSSQIWAMDANGDSRSAVQLTSGSNDGRQGMAPLADGRIVFMGGGLFVMHQDGSGRKPILPDGLIPDEPRSSPGSPYLVFCIYDWPYSHLFRARADGSELTQLTFGESREGDSSISNDGKWVAYGRQSVPGSNTDISLWKISIHGGEPTRLKQDNCLMPHFSPDDKLLSCVEDQKTIHILSSEDGQLIRSLPVSTVAWLYSGARWAPDGRSVAYIVTEGGVSNIWLHPIDGGEPRPLTDFKTASIYNFVFSPDGKSLFLARGNQMRDVTLIRRRWQ